MLTFPSQITRTSLIFLITFASSSSDSPKEKLSNFNDPFIDTERFGNLEGSESRVKRDAESCFPEILCGTVPNVNKYRTADGTCNNLAHPHWGASNIPFLRFLPRTPSGGDFRCPSCPRPRTVSSTINAILPHGNRDGITLMVMQWGQITDHDLLFTPEDTDHACCQDFRTPEPTSASCCPIDVTGDDFYSTLDPPVTCLPFVRSKPACTEIPNGDRETINERTAYLDASSVYGSTPEEFVELRTFEEGRLKIGNEIESGYCFNGQDVCPMTFLPSRIEGGETKFFAGDHRVEHQPALTSLHTVLVRLHNDIASKLSCGDDENTFQTTRKIVGALVQQITFDEFLPIVIGPYYMSKFDLYLNQATTYYNTYNYGYNENLKASARNVFATAVFRFGHSLVPNEFFLQHKTIKLAEVFENHGVTLNPHSHPSDFLGNIIIQDSEPMDHFIVDALINKLLATEQYDFKFGSDLHARNIKRGRDHGIPGYVAWFNWCAAKRNAPLITTFDDLDTYMPQSVVDAFKDLYDNVEDIDLFPAGIAEFEVSGGLLGPTFACIMAEQFHYIKYGDRFWFENPGVFTPQQVQSIRNTKLSAIICHYTTVYFSQPYVMLKDHPNTNPIEKCSRLWKDGVLKDIKTNIWNDIC